MLSTRLVFAAFLLAAAPAAAGPIPEPAAPGLKVIQAKAFCGWYVILGCHGARAAAQSLRAELGGPGAGGGAGLKILNTNEYPNLKDGYYCVGDGPYASRDEAASIAWREAVPDAYVKRGC